ncbi:MAG TPA: serine/threonine-protein kinase [Solirubrobacterales bacterium]|nr:serine/threonine-protein kinase [Solirubrobacterales bacterium]
MTDATATGPDGEGGEFLEPGTTFAGHRIEEVIGSGGMGIVYRVRHLALDRERALKVVAPKLSAEERFRERFKREARLAAQVEHPNLIAIHHAGEEGGQLYLAMRLVDGVDLRSLVDGSGPLDPARAVRVLAGVAAGLDAAHARGLIHRDVKPANVLVERAGDAEHVFLTDFGISRLAGSEESLTTTGEFFGSVDYVAPEQIEGEPVDGRTDVYALGGVLHFMLTGRPPFPRDTELAKLFAHANAPPPRPSDVVPGLPPAVDDVVAKAMAKRPDGRHASAGELAAAAATALGQPPPVPPPPPPARNGAADGAQTRPLRRPARRRLTAAIAALAAVAAAVAGAVLLSDGDGSESQGPAGPQPKAIATIKVGENPTGITVGGANVWVAIAGAVEALDPVKERPVGNAIAIDGDPTSVAVGFGSLWVPNHSGDTVVRLKLGSPGGAQNITVGDQPTDVAVDGNWVWVSNGGDDTVSRVNPQTNRVRTVRAGAGPRSVATGEGAVWVANIDGKSVSQIDPQGAITIDGPVPVGQRPNDLAVGFGSVWVVDNFSGTLTRIDPDTHRVEGEPIEVGSHPRGVKAGFGYLWVANGADGTVTRIDPEAAAPAGPPIDVGANPADIAVGRGAVWTANVDSSTVTKIRP